MTRPMPTGSPRSFVTLVVLGELVSTVTFVAAGGRYTPTSAV